MQAALRPGEIFQERYELISVLGAGGVGTVYKARQIDFDRIVALKILHPEIAADEEYKARFLREAQALSVLKHPNIVTVYHLGATDEGIPYLVMEYISGKSVRSLLNESQKISVVQACLIVKDAAKALHYVHSHGIIHRDLKPENLIVEEQANGSFEIKIIDFGLAHVDGPVDQKLTGTGNLIGTVFYMSPEQCRGQRLDQRSDVYSLTVCFYEMITGTHPFVADNPVGMLYQHVNASIPALAGQEFRKYQPALNELLQSGLAKSPSDRIADMESMMVHCDKVLSSSHTRNWKYEKALQIFLVIILPVIVGAGLIYFARNAKESKSPDQISSSNSITEMRLKRGSLLQRLASIKQRKAHAVVKYDANPTKLQQEQTAILNDLEALLPFLETQPVGVRFAAMKLKFDIEYYLHSRDFEDTLNKALRLSRVNGKDTIQSAECYATLSSYYLNRGGPDNLRLAEVNAKKALKISGEVEKQPDSVPRLSIPESVDSCSLGLLSVNPLINLAEVAAARRQFDLELDYFKLAAIRCGAQGFHRFMITCSHRAANVELARGNTKNAKRLISDCRQYLKEILEQRTGTHTGDTMSDLVVLGDAAQSSGMKDEAIATYKLVEEMDHNLSGLGFAKEALAEARKRLAELK